jgi:hypothetical protein
MRTKILPIVLPPPLYRKLELDGRAQERDAVQQARWILKRHLEDPAMETAAGREPASAVPA